MFPKGAYFVLISPQSGQPVLDVMRWAESRGMTPSHIQVRNPAAKAGTGEWLDVLKSRGVTGYSISSLQDLPAVLGGDAAV
ncbi:hypothetical protein D3C75_932090 [compost metagenome]